MCIGYFWLRFVLCAMILGKSPITYLRSCALLSPMHCVPFPFQETMNHLCHPTNDVTRRPHSSHTSCGLPTYHCNQIPPLYKEPFIITGYRKTDASISECVRYAFVCHNDVWNFWTHFLPLLAWLVWLYYISHQYDLSQSYYYPLLCFWAGGCSYALFSSIAHLFECKSVYVRTICYMVDYLGISLYAAGDGIYCFYHQQPLTSPLYDYMLPVVALHLVFSAAATLISSLSRYYWNKHRFLIRALAFCPAYFTAITSFCLRLLTCVSTGEDCMYRTIHLHVLGMVLSWILVFFFVSKVPERFAPGKFDIFFQSHTLFHLSAAAMTSVQMYTYPIDSEARKASLLAKISPSFQSVFLPFLILIAVEFLQVGILALLVVKGVLIPNKAKPSYKAKQQ